MCMRGSAALCAFGSTIFIMNSLNSQHNNTMVSQKIKNVNVHAVNLNIESA